MKIIGIEPKAPGLHIFSKIYIPRLGLPQLLTIAENTGHECEIYCEELTPIVWERVAEADMVLISSITSTAPRAFSLIEKIREVNKKAALIMGGPHVTFLPEEALDKGVDYVFRNEADDSFPMFLKWYSSERDFRSLAKISGLSFKVGNSYHHTAHAPRVDLNVLPTPNLDLICGFGKPTSIPIISSRGCPWDCEFCSEISMFGRGYRFRSEDKVIEDMKYYDRRYGKVPIFFAEDNFGANRQRLERLCNKIIQNGLVRCIEGQVRLDLGKQPNTLKLMSRAGFQRAYIGYESTNPDSLISMGKGLKENEMEHLTKVFHRSGIAIHAMWVIGFDDDSLETVKTTVRSCIKWHIETTQFLILVPIPGSRLFERLKKEDRIFNWDWSRYDGHHVNFYPKKMTPRQLQVAVILEAMPRMYGIWLTIRIFVINNFQTGLAMLKGRWHPFREFRSNVETLIARLWGKIATRRIKKPIGRYIEEIPAVTEKARI